jgi:flagellar protein FlaJ
LLGVTPISPDRIPLPIALAIPITPLVYPGWRVRREGMKVRNRDEEFPSFIRALGAVESVKQASTGSVLQSLRQKDFGSLTGNVDALYKRLNMRIDNVRSWELFAAETGSYLIQKFGDMYVVARQMGGDPKLLGKIISDNINEVLKVREKRQQAATTITGVLYGITATSVFSFFIGLEVVEIMIEITDGMDINQEVAGDLLHTGQYDLVTMEYLLIVMIFVNAVLSAIMIRVIDRDHIVSGLVHVVFMTWLGAIIASLTQYVVDFVISV